MKHRFAAILAADVVRFSGRMETDSEATVRALQECRDVFRHCVSRHHGREFGSVGDSFMAEFASPVEALRAAREFQAQIDVTNAGAAERDRLELRIGLHAGDVVAEGDDLFGDVVNTAARLQALAKPGGIAMSGFFHTQVHKEAGFQFRALGTHHLKNIAEPVAVFEVASRQRAFNWRRIRLMLLPYKGPAAAVLGAMIASVVVIAYFEGREPGIGSVVEVPSNVPDGQSIAVLPFQNLSGDAEQDHFAEQMTGILITELTKIDGLVVQSRRTTEHYASMDKPLAEIAHELGVNRIIEGSTQLTGDEVRLNLQLVDGATDRNLWAERYRRDIANIFHLQSEVARAIAGELRIELTPEAEARLAGRRSVVPEAFRFWLIGNQHIKGLHMDSFEKASRAFEHAIELDPEFANAYAGIAQVHAARGSWFGDRPANEVVPAAKDAAQMAIQLDPNLAEAHFALAALHVLDWEWESADQAFKRGSELNPSDSLGLVQYANFLAAMGRFDEALKIVRRAVAIDPLSPGTRNELGGALWLAGDPDAAYAEVEYALELDPDFFQTHWLIADWHLWQGEYDKAMPFLTGLRQNFETLAPGMIGFLGSNLARVGQTEDARYLLNYLLNRSETEYLPGSTPAFIYVALGEYDQAMDWLEVAYDQKDIQLMWLRENEYFAELRGHPRFQDLVARMNFPVKSRSEY